MSEAREKLIELLNKTSEIYDVYLNAGYDNIYRFLHGARVPKERYEDANGTYTEYTPEGAREVEYHLVATKIKEMYIRSHHDYIEVYNNNPHVDIELVNALLKPTQKRLFCMLDLAIGKISDEEFIDGRFKYLCNQFLYCVPDGNEGDANEALEGNIKHTAEIISAAKEGKVLRIWCYNNSTEICALYYLMHALRKVNCNVILMHMPEKVIMANGRTKRSKKLSWGMFPPEEMALPVSQCNAHIITENEKAFYSSEWERLAAENSEIRVYQENRVVSAELDEYLQLVRNLCPSDRKFRLLTLDGKIYKEVKRRGLDYFPYYFWASLYFMLIDEGTLQELGRTSTFWEYDRWVRYVEK